MTASERRDEIMRIMIARRQETIPNLADELGVSRRTIERDILSLTATNPLETVQGNGGGVRLPEWYHPYRNTLSREQTATLANLMGRASEEERTVLRQLIREHSNFAPDYI